MCLTCVQIKLDNTFIKDHCQYPVARKAHMTNSLFQLSSSARENSIDSNYKNTESSRSQESHRNFDSSRGLDSGRSLDSGYRSEAKTARTSRGRGEQIQPSKPVRK